AAPWPIQRRVVLDFENAPIPERPVVPLVETVHERLTLEIQRGCPHGCRFCQASMICRPWRPRSIARLLEAARAGIAATGYDEIGLLSLSTGDYPHLEELAQALEKEFAPQKVSLSLPSLRVDDVLRDLPSRFCAVRRSGLTFAPETGSETLRAAVNKHVSNEALLAAAAAAYGQGWRTIKLYFMIGLPGETEEDVAAIAALANQVARLRPRGGNMPAVHLAVSNFVPKPHTAFQWEAMAEPEVLRAKAEAIAKRIDRRRVEYKCHDVLASHWEGVLARGDRRLGKVIIRAWRLGARLDAWSDHFRPERWEQAMQEEGLDSRAYACRERRADVPQPWSHIDIGVSSAFLKQERAKAHARQQSPSCSRSSCAGCGLQICPWRQSS
ncbi:MAG: radical SAM protein, partial [Planctomycetota bacterium]|nr:radical SAM protein [Planctomycetota bacterium]